MPEPFQIESARKLSRKKLRSKIDELLAAIETAAPEQRDLLAYKADIYIRELDRKRDYWSWVSTRDLILEVIVIGLIGWEISLSYKADVHQEESFKKQQEVLSDMLSSSKSTAATLSALKNTTEACTYYDPDHKGMVLCPALNKAD